jgi:glutaminyl-peptide cyclotransferase
MVLGMEFLHYKNAIADFDRSLAETWEATAHAALSTYKTALSSISLFLLLDLLGAAKPRVPSYFKTTHWAYQSLAKIELRLRSLGLLQSKPDQPFLPEFEKPHDQFNTAWGVLDDHIPFMARGVEVLHMIPTPFPHVWHTIDDDGEHLDGPTVEDWARMVTAFVGEWMDLEGYFPDKKLAEAKFRAKRKESLSKDEL